MKFKQLKKQYSYTQVQQLLLSKYKNYRLVDITELRNLKLEFTQTFGYMSNLILDGYIAYESYNQNYYVNYGKIDRVTKYTNCKDISMTIILVKK